MIKISKKLFWFISVIFVCAVIFLAYVDFVKSTSRALVPTITEVRADSSEYKYINPLLYVKTSKSLYDVEFSTLLSSVNNYITTSVNSHNADNVSFYYRDLNSGHWTGINESDQYEPSSMLKVLTIMATAHLIEEGIESPSQYLSYKPDDANQYYKPDDNLPSGNYSVQDMMKYAIAYSDNGANDALLNDSSMNGEFTNLYNLVRLPQASTTRTDFMSTISYSTIWRTLYNATYLSSDSSEQVLNLLTATTFDNGIVAGVPNGTVVAHKFGENTNYLNSGSLVNHELHDCGIIYHPDHPYLLCIMTKGQAFPNLEKVISNISKIAYDYTASKYPIQKK
jgi:beta-lactamase class A